MPLDPIKTVKIEDKGTYEVRHEEYDWSDMGVENGPHIMPMAYTKDGAYIGTPEEAEYICGELGLIPSKASDEHNVCSIGFNEKEQKWYGWSHRAMFGWAVGDTYKPGDSGHEYWGVDGEVKIKDLNMAKKAAINFAKSVSKVQRKTIEASYKFVVKSDDGEVEIRLTDGRIPMEMLKDPKKAQKHWDKKQNKSPKNKDQLKKVK